VAVGGWKNVEDEEGEAGLIDWWKMSLFECS
jgi:hypothetical protein